jgi:hypothetical protein
MTKLLLPLACVTMLGLAPGGMPVQAMPAEPLAAAATDMTRPATLQEVPYGVARRSARWTVPRRT